MHKKRLLIKKKCIANIAGNKAEEEEEEEAKQTAGQVAKGRGGGQGGGEKKVFKWKSFLIKHFKC